MPLFNFIVHATTITETGGAADINQIPVIVGNFLGIAAALAGMLAVIAIIIGGFKYIFAQGDPKATQSARGTITWAVVGLVLLAVAYLVLVLIKQVTGIDVTTFKFSIQ